MLLIKGAGDIASGIACRLFRSGYRLVMTDLYEPTAVRRTVCFCEAVRSGSACVEHIVAERADTASEAEAVLKRGNIPVIPADKAFGVTASMPPAAVIDARLAKVNPDTQISEAPVVIGIGPGFTAGLDCHAVVETKRGHYLGRVLYQGCAIPNTGIPGNIGGFTEERVLRAPCGGVFMPLRQIGDSVAAGDIIATVNGMPVTAKISGLLRGLLPEGITVFPGMKSGDIDPRNEADYCLSVSDKALSVGGGVLEALLHFSCLPD